MPQSALRFSPAVAADAGRFFARHRCMTKFGLLHLGSLVMISVLGFFYYKHMGADWFIGFLGTIVSGGAILVASSFVFLPRALAKADEALPSLEGQVDTRPDGFELSRGGHRIDFRWSRIKYIWPRESFIVLGLSQFMMLYIPAEGMTSEVRAEFEARASPLIGA